MRTRWAGALLLALVVTGCSSVSNGPDEAALHYEDGPFSNKKFHNCVDPSDREYDGPGDQFYKYPTSQRNLDFSKDDGADAAPITFVSKDGIEMSVTGVLNFRLDTACKEVTVQGKKYPGGVLQFFHELIGNRYDAYNDGDDQTSKGWERMLRIYVYKPLDTAIDRAGQQYTYQQLYNDATVKAEWEQSVLAQLPALVDRQTDGDVEFFKDYALTLQKPDPPREIKAALLEQQKAVAEANAAKAKADAQVAQAEAETNVAVQQAAKQKATIEGFGGFQNYIQYVMAQQGLNPFQPQIVVGASSASNQGGNK